MTFSPSLILFIALLDYWPIYYTTQRLMSIEETLQERKYEKLAHVNLPLCLAADTVCGLISGLAVAPTCTIVDRSVIQNANGSMTLWQGVKQGLKTLFFKPMTFAKSVEFKLLFFVYSTTYIAANTSESIWVAKDKDPVIPKLLTTFAVNTAAGIYKDKALTQHFGKKTVTAFPLKSYLLFWTRDVITIAFAFTFPKIFGKWLSERSKYTFSEATKIFQILCPLIIQFVATPMHLLGLDFYNNPDRTPKERMQFLRQVGAETLVIRMARFLPAYGLAGVLNIVLRDNLDRILKEKVDKA